MKKINLLLICLFLLAATSIAQQKKYISYAVKKGETIKSIAKQYKLSTRDLRRLNPDVGRKPRANTVIIVPNKNYGKPVVIKPFVTANLYTVKPKETLYHIAKQYGITIGELKAANAILKDGLKIGMKLVIPTSIKKEEVSLNKFLLHTVVKDDTVYNLTKRFEVSRKELLKLNPQLSNGLKLGMVLKIKPISEVIKGNEEGVELEEKNSKEFTESLEGFNRQLNVVLMLPYQLNKNKDSVAIQNLKKGNSLLNIATEFHLGALMAIDSLKQKGISIKVTHFDTENSNQKLQLIVNNNDFSSTDLVVGPMFYSKAYWLSKEIKAPIIAPLYSKKQLTLSHSNLVKSAPNSAMVEERLLEYMKVNYKGENIIILNDGLATTQSKLWKTVTKIKTFDSIQNVSVVKSTKGYIDNEKIAEKLKEDSNNWVLLITDDTVITAAAVNNLKVFIDDYNLTLFSFNKGKNFDKIENAFLGKLNFVYPTSSFLSLQDVNTRNFFKKYKAKNYAVPSKYAIRGFDVTYDLLLRLASYNNLEDGLNAGISKRVSSMFDYNKKLFGSFDNNGVYLIQYDKELNTVLLK